MAYNKTPNTEAPEMIEKVVYLNRVSKTVKGGRVMKFSALVDGTIPHDVVGIYGAGTVMLKPATEGTGVIAGGAVRAVMEAVGVRNICAKCLRSNNPQNVVKATMEGLKTLRSAAQIAEIRGKSVEEII